MSKCILCNNILSEQEMFIDPDTGVTNQICYSCEDPYYNDSDDDLFWNTRDVEDVEDDYL